ncbi:MAG: alkaline phosphatase D family protein [Planctomycetota bacterium]
MIAPRLLALYLATSMLLASHHSSQAQAETPVAAGASDKVFQATGIKIGEVTPSKAIVWTRVTARPSRNSEDLPGVKIRYAKDTHKASARRGVVEAIEYPPGATVDDLPGAAPGAAGQTRVLYRAGTDAEWMATDWAGVDAAKDFTRQISLKGLLPSTEYQLAVEARQVPSGDATSRVEGEFRTAPSADEPGRVVFTVVTGQGNYDQDSPDGFLIYETMLKLKPSFFAHTGDIIYYDRVSKTLPLARYLWHRNWSWPLHTEFHRQVPSYFEKDDHDTLVNDCWPSMDAAYMHELTFAQGVEVFLEQVPMRGKTYRTFRWGKDLQIWLVEGRDFRSPNTAPDGPDKTIWGEEQMAWFKRTVAESDATFRVLISPTPVVGPDRSKKNDNHSNAGFQHEGAAIREFLASQKNMLVVCGDRHWQYMSVDPTTGLREYSCGPASDKHAGGWSDSDYYPDYHRFLKVKGGFLSGTVERTGDKPSITFRFHAVDGTVRHTDTVVAK